VSARVEDGDGQRLTAELTSARQRVVDDEGGFLEETRVHGSSLPGPVA
jgi:hypothetical protein